MAKRKAPAGIDEQLRQAIIASNLTSYRLGADAGIRPEIIDRFVGRQRDIRMATASKIATALGLALRPA